mmetsp:Transcript_30826/g.98279  ORF Transcript_30826/g.98279 Transcript_30826/m.98279 type:complete len:490 (+) Transcript_30826:77-1546(+)
MSTSEVIEKVARGAGHVADAIKGFAEEVEEKERRIYDENSHLRGARNLHAAVRAPILACQGLRIQAVNSASEAVRCRVTRGIYHALDGKFKKSGPSEPSDEKGVQVLMHRTSPAAGRSILASRHMRPGREGTLGAGIYFAETAEACAKKAQIYGSKAYALVTASVDLGRCRVVKHGELEWRMVRDCGFKQSDLEELGFSSVGTNFHGGWEYCVFDPARVAVLDVTFHGGGGGSEASEEDSSGSAPEAAAALRDVPEALVRAAGSSSWTPYRPNPRVVAVIAPGAGMRKHAYLYKELGRQGYDVVPIFDDSYDHYPPGTEVLGSIGITGLRMPDMRFNRTKNLATFVDDVVLPKIRDLIAEGRGPAVVIAASRGGIVSVPRLWEAGWRGPSVVGNGGFVSTAAVPASAPCVLVTAGWDSFTTRRPETTASLLRKEDPSTPVLLYHDPREDHDLNCLTGKVLGRLVELAATGNLDATAPGPWPQGAGLRLL